MLVLKREILFSHPIKIQSVNNRDMYKMKKTAAIAVKNTHLTKYLFTGPGTGMMLSIIFVLFLSCTALAEDSTSGTPAKDKGNPEKSAVVKDAGKKSGTVTPKDAPAKASKTAQKKTAPKEAAAAVSPKDSPTQKPAAQQDDRIIARINGTPIHEWELALAEAEIGSELARIPAVERRAVLVRYIMDTQLLADAAKKEKLDTQPDFARRKQYLHRRALRDAYFQKHVREAVTVKDAQRIYDKQIGSRKPKIEVRASHILVKTEKEARAIIKELAAGKDFAKLAEEKSTGPSKVSGGDLGYFTKGRMVKPFSDAAFALKKGDISQPVRTKYGWHVIKLTDKRERPNIPFEVVKDRILAPLMQQKSSDVVDELRKGSKVELLDAEIKKNFESAN